MKKSRLRDRIRCRRTLLYGFFCLSASVGLTVSGCSKGDKPQEEEEDDVLVVVEDSALRMRDVLLRIPSGIPSEDSTRLFHAIVSSWVDDRLLEEVAVENIDDMDRIENLVAEYRRMLISEAYKRKMRQNASVKISEDSLKSYFTRHEGEWVLETPLVKGIYLKVPAGSPMLQEIRSWVFSGSPDAIDKIEKVGLEEAVQYDYFGDRWVEFSTISELIPFRFGNPNMFLGSNRNFETVYNGNAYLLHVFDYIPEGKEMPYEYARRVIAERLRNEHLGVYEKKLIRDIRSVARREGRLSTPGYDLEKRKVTLDLNHSPGGSDQEKNAK